MPVLDGGEFCRIHVNEALTNDHPKVFHGGSIKGAFQDLERQAMFPEMRKDSMSSLMV